jgi:hypothetical protein
MSCQDTLLGGGNWDGVGSGMSQEPNTERPSLAAACRGPATLGEWKGLTLSLSLGDVVSLEMGVLGDSVGHFAQRHDVNKPLNLMNGSVCVWHLCLLSEAGCSSVPTTWSVLLYEFCSIGKGVRFRYLFLQQFL